MQLKVSSQAAVLYLSGVVHRETADLVESAFNKALESGAPCIVVSFQDVKALLSDGIRLMIALCDRARHAGKGFHITDLPKEVRYALQITNLLTLLGHAGYTLNLLQDRKIDPQALQPVEIPVAAVADPEPTAPAQAAQPAHASQPSHPAHASGSAPATPAAAAPAGRPASAPSSAASKPQAPAAQHAAHPAKDLTDAELWNLIRGHFPGRNEFRIAEYMARPGVNVKSLADIMAALRSDKETTVGAMKRLISRGTVHTVGGGLFNFSGSEELRGQLAHLARLLQNQQMHGKILKLLMDAERH